MQGLGCRRMPDAMHSQDSALVEAEERVTQLMQTFSPQVSKVNTYKQFIVRLCMTRGSRRELAMMHTQSSENNFAYRVLGLEFWLLSLCTFAH